MIRPYSVSTLSIFPTTLSTIVSHMGACQNCGLFLDPYYNTAPKFRVLKKRL